MTTTVEVFDPAMCCSTGVCGTDVDPTLSRFAADLDWLATQGIVVTRATLAQEPGKFVASAPVRSALEASGTDALPAILVDGRLASTGRYPSRAELAQWAGAAPTTPSPTPDATEPAPSAPAPLKMAGGCCGGSGQC